MTHCAKLKVGLLSATMFTGAALAVPAMAQEMAAATTVAAPEEVAAGDIVVTATRRATTIQDTPINIAALSAETLESQRIDDVKGLAAFTPGLTISDTGPRSAGTIVMRGLSATDTGTTGNNTDNAMGIYLGEVPLYYDFKLLDLERVEVLLGPQGTLYGLGTLAGAIRYIPQRPDLNRVSGEVHGRAFLVSHSKDVGYQADGVINLPIVTDHIAFRSVVGYYFDPGFIDNPLLLREPGVSLPQAGGTGNMIGDAYDANLYERKDVNSGRTFTTRNQLLVQTSEDFKAIVSYAYQQTKFGGAQSNSAGVLGTRKYENATRYSESGDRHAHLVSLELNANLGEIATLVSTTAYTNVKSDTSGDVTDLLLDLDYGYELFPAFSGFNNNKANRKQFNQEVRLVSRHGGPFSWVIGGFYNRQKDATDYFESTPGLANYYGITGNPQDLEYVSYTKSKVTEKAVFGEGTFRVTDAWQVTAGARYFKYSSSLVGAVTLPLLGEPLDPHDIDASGGSAKDDGVVWKFNTSYKINEGLMVYGTYSKGYRIGGPNRIAPCPAVIPGGQIICALPEELQFGPDKTKNKEIGIRATLFDRKLTANLALYHIDWDGIQLRSSTFYGGTGITVNGGKARSKGAEFSFQARPVPRLTIQGTYSYNDAELTEDVEGLLQVRVTPGDYSARPKFERVDVLAGDRLPGSAKNSGSLGATYAIPLTSGEIVTNWTATYRGSVLSRTGLRGYGEAIPSYVTHRAAINYVTDRYEIGLFANNIFDKYAITTIDNDRSRVGVNDGVAVRYYARGVLAPRQVGIEGRMKF